MAATADAPVVAEGRRTVERGPYDPVTAPLGSPLSAAVEEFGYRDPVMAWFRKTPNTPADYVEVKEELRRLREAMDRHEQHVRTVTQSFAGQTDAAPAGGVDVIDQTLTSRSGDDVSARLDGVVEQLGSLDARITSVSRELANQLSELGNDIEALHDRPAGTPVDEEVLDDLRGTQERLANEQVRYQIAFRADLARLAEQLRRPPADPPPRRR